MQKRTTQTRKGRRRRARSMGRYPWLPAVTEFLEGVEPYYSKTTLRTMTRGLNVIHEALLELRRDGKVSTTNPKKLTKQDVEMFLEWMKTRGTRNGTGLNPTTRANYMQFLESLLKWVGNPVITQMRALHYIRFPQKVPSQVQVLSSEEIEELRDRLKDMPGWAGSVARFMVAMYGYSGLRRSELRRARLVDLDTEGWTIVVAHPKGENSWATPGIAVILPPARAGVLAFLDERKEYLQKHGVPGHESLVPRVYHRPVCHHDTTTSAACTTTSAACTDMSAVYTSTSVADTTLVDKEVNVGYFTDGMWGSVKDDAQRYAGMPFKMQQLRASFAQMCKDRGASIEAVSRALRHSTTVTTERYYARIRPEDAFREIEDAFNRPRRAR